MFKIICSAKPTKKNEIYNEIKNAVVEFYIDYKDFGGAIVLANFYLEEQNWIAEEFSDNYWEIKSEKDVEKIHLDFYKEALNYGFCIIYNAVPK